MIRFFDDLKKAASDCLLLMQVGAFINEKMQRAVGRRINLKRNR